MRTVSTLALALALAVPAVPAAASTPRPTCEGRPATIVGTPDDDRIVGTGGDDVIVALGGSDRVVGRGGDDLICGGDGDDRLYGGAGDDRLLGGRGGRGFDRGGTYLDPNVLAGGRGDDYLDPGLDKRRTTQGGTVGYVSWRSARRAVQVDLGAGGTGTATGQGADTIRVRPLMGVEATRYDDLVVGSPGDDAIFAGRGDDEVHAGDGDDYVSPEADFARGPADDDLVYGDAGKDTIVAEHGRDVLHGGPGKDAIQTYSSLPSAIYGEDGDDDLSGIVTASPGYVVDGGPGRDTAYVEAPDVRRTSPLSTRGVTVTAQLAVGTLSRDGVVTGTLAAVEELDLGFYLRWVYYGTEGPDVVTGGDHGFQAWTYGGDDVVTGSYGADYVDAGDGTDTVDGLGGKDTCLDAEQRVSCELG